MTILLNISNKLKVKILSFVENIYGIGFIKLNINFNILINNIYLYINISKLCKKVNKINKIFFNYTF
jgi:hypothetical protein